MTVYFLTDGIYRTAGTERVIFQLASSLKNVVVIVPGKTDCAFLSNSQLSIRSLNIGEFPSESKLKKINHRIDYFNNINKQIKFKPGDKIVTFAFDLNVLNVLISKKNNLLPILCEHIEYNYHSKFRNSLRKIVYRLNNAKLICLTKTDTLKFKNDGINAITIPNYVYPVNYKYNYESKKIISIGRLEYQKNFSFLIQAFWISNIFEDGWTLDIVGEGTEKEMLQDQINELKMQKFITIHNFTKNIDKYYSRSSLMCMTSRFEAFPMVLLEALNFSLPVLVTDFPTGAKEILGNENKQIVNKYDPDVFAKELKMICNDQQLRLSLSNDNEALIKNFYPENILKIWNDILY